MPDTTDSTPGSSRRVVDVPIDVDLHAAVTRVLQVDDDHDEPPPLETLNSQRIAPTPADETERMDAVLEPLASLDTTGTEEEQSSPEVSRSLADAFAEAFRSITARLTDPHLWAAIGHRVRHAARTSWERITRAGTSANVQTRQLSALAAPAARRAGHAFDRNAGVILLLATIVLLSLGAVLIFSSSSKVAMETESMRDPAFFLKKHLVFLGIALLGCLAGFCLPADKLRKSAPLVYIGALALLVLVLIPGIGTSFNGARRWFRFGPIGFQPSDVAKLALVIALAHHLSLGRVRRNFGSFERGFVPFLAILAPVCGLIVLEPDFGTTLFLCGVAVAMYLIAGGRTRHIALAAVPLVLLLAIVVIIKFDHVQPRIDAWVNPDADPSGKGYQVRQSLIALGAGGTTGVGLGQSRQALWYLPEESTDFIFAILGEELGFLGVLLALSAYIVLVIAGFRIAGRAPDRFRQLLAAGLTLLIGLQAAINIAVVTASIPNKGIALPFISFGGSLTFFYLVAVGVILGVAASIREPGLASQPDPTGSDDQPQACRNADFDEEESDPINHAPEPADEQGNVWQPQLVPAFASANEPDEFDDNDDVLPVTDSRISLSSRSIIPVTEKVQIEDVDDDRRIA